MKILILSDDFPPQSFGGAGIVAFDLAKSLARGGDEVRIVTAVRNADEAGEMTYEGLRITRIHSRYNLQFQAYISLNNRPVVKQVKAILRDFKPDIVHAHNVHAYLSYASLKAAKKSGAGIILTCHDVMSFSYGKLTEFIDKKNLSVPTSFNYHLRPFQQFWTYRLRFNPLRNIIIRHMLRKYVDHVIAVSHALKQAMNDNGIDNVKVIHNAIEAAEWNVDPGAVRSFKETNKVGDSAILFGGRLSGIKGGRELILVLAQVIKQVPDVQLLVVGSKNRYAKRMAEIADEIGLSGRLIFTGWLKKTELPTVYHSAALVVTPSLCFDTFIMVNLEAMACGKPAITTCFGGSKEVVQDGVTGYVVNPFDVRTMADKICELLTDREKAARFGAAGYERALKEFSLDDCAEQYRKLFSQAAL